MAEQFSNAPAPSREEFEDLAEQIANVQLKLINSPSFQSQSTDGAEIATLPSNYNMAILTICKDTSLSANGVAETLLLPRGGSCWGSDGANAKRWDFNVSTGAITGVKLAGDITTHWKVFSVYGVNYTV